MTDDIPRSPKSRTRRLGGLAVVVITGLVSVGACATPARPVPGIQISSPRPGPTERLVIPFDNGTDEHDLIRTMLTTARARGAIAVSEIAIHMPLARRGRTFDCVSLVGSADDVSARANALLTLSKRYYALRPQRRRPMHCERQARNTVLAIGSGCRQEPTPSTSQRFQHQQQNDFTPADWKDIGSAYADIPMAIAEPQLCIRNENPPGRQLRATMHFAAATTAPGQPARRLEQVSGENP